MERKNSVEAYLDNAATTKVATSVSELIHTIMCRDFGNPSSKHMKGVEAERYIKTAEKAIAKTLKCKPGNLLFTSGGTESNNMAILGTAMSHRRAGKHIISTVIEHPSVHEPLFFMEEDGYEVTYLPVDSMGRVNPGDLRKAMREDTILVTMMYVNNEIGSINPVEECAKVIHECNPDTCFHVDAIQAYGKMKIYPGRMGIDLMSVSGHKIHGPKGIGFLYVGDHVKIHPIIFGGGQQKGMRSGTENVPGIAGMGEAAKAISQNLEEKRKSLQEKKAYFANRLQAELTGVTLNGYSSEAAPHILSVSFEGIKSEVLLHALEEKNIYVSSGSACSSNHPGISGTLKAIGVKQELLDSTLRFSFCFETTQEELDYTVEELKELLPVLRRFTHH